MAGAAVQGKRKTKVGRVVSDKMDKTIVVSVERMTRHPLYKRVIRLTTKFKAHDEDNEAHVATRSLSRSRGRFRDQAMALVSIVARAGEGTTPEPVVEDEAIDEAIHGAAHPGKHTADREAAR